MTCLAIIFSAIVLVGGKPYIGDQECEPGCRGAAYQCIDGQCFCTVGYVPNPTQSRCMRCPGFGEKCYGVCCNYNGNATLTCWKGYCQPCYDNMDHWICRDSIDQQMLLVSSTQIAMAIALLLGIIATFVLFYKICAATTVRQLGTSNDPRLSIGSLQFYIDERLRDAPPRYTRGSPIASAAIIPASVYVNAGFIHDSSVPPPPYTLEKDEDSRNPVPTIHI